MKKNTYMHFEEESIIYSRSKFQLDICMFDSNILLTKFGPGFLVTMLLHQPGPQLKLPSWRYKSIHAISV